MDVEQPEVAKKQKVMTGKDIIDIDMIEEPVTNPTIIEEEKSQAITEHGVEKFEGKKEAAPEPILKYKRYSYASAHESEFKSKQDLLSHYMAHRRESYTHVQKKM